MKTINVKSTNQTRTNVRTGGGYTYLAKKCIFALCVVVLLSLTFTCVAFAEETAGPPTDTADQLWASFVSLIQKWLYRITIIIALIGGIVFFIGWGTDDHSKKILGGTMFISGLMAFGFVALMYNFFFV